MVGHGLLVEAFGRGLASGSPIFNLLPCAIGVTLFESINLRLKCALFGDESILEAFVPLSASYCIPVQQFVLRGYYGFLLASDIFAVSNVLFTKNALTFVGP